MRKSLLLFVLLLSSLAGAQNYLTVTGSNTHGYGGALLPAGGLIFTATDSRGTPISYQAGGGGQSVRYPVTCSIANGVVASGCLVANVSVSNPANFCYSVQIVDSANRLVLGGPQSGYQCVQPQTTNFWCSAGTCNFDQYVPNIPTALTMLLPLPTPATIGGVYQASCASPLVMTGILSTGQPNCGSVAGTGNVVGSGLTDNLPLLGAGGSNIKVDTANIVALTGFDINAANQVTGLRGAALPLLSGFGYLNWSGTAWLFTNPFNNIALTGSITAPIIGCWQGASNGVVSGTGLPCGSGGGGGNINPGVVGQFGFYLASGSTLSPNTLLSDSGSLLAYTGLSGVSATQYAVNGSGAFVFGGTYGAFSPPGASLSNCGFGSGGMFSCSFNNGPVTAMLQAGGVNGADITAGTVAAARIGDLSSTYLLQAQVGAAGYAASLDNTGNVPQTQLGNVVIVGNNYALTGYCQSNVSAANVLYYLEPTSGSTTSNCASTSVGAEMPVTSAGTAKSLYVTSVTKGSNVSDIILYVNGAATSLLCSIASASTCNDSTHTVTLHQGDTWSLRYNPGGVSDTAQGIRAAFQVAVSAGYTEVGFCPGLVGATNAIYVLVPSTSAFACTGTGATEVPIPVSGTATNLYVNASAAGNHSSTVVLYINGVATALTCSIGSATTCSDQLDQIPFNAGSTWSLRYVTGGASDTASDIHAAFQVF